MRTSQRKPQRQPKPSKTFINSKKTVSISFRVNHNSYKRWKFIADRANYKNFSDYIRNAVMHKSYDATEPRIIFNSIGQQYKRANNKLDSNHKIKIRLTQKELSGWKQAAKSSGLNLSGWLRTCLQIKTEEYFEDFIFNTVWWNQSPKEIRDKAFCCSGTLEAMYQKHLQDQFNKHTERGQDKNND